jgi:hypothetical protein
MQCTCSHRKGMRTHLYGRVRVNSKPKSQADCEYEGDVNLTRNVSGSVPADRPLMRCVMTRVPSSPAFWSKTGGCRAGMRKPWLSGATNVDAWSRARRPARHDAMLHAVVVTG